MKKSTRFLITILLLLVFGFGYYSYSLKTQAKTTEVNNYNYSFLELVNNVNNIENYLAKAMISSDSKHSTDTLIKIWADSNLAVSYMKNIP
ncbi:MAG: germination protein YpeB, partial [Clostridia bacterium]|nr:germination protein YpeB [Clostridia bacterium]